MSFDLAEPLGANLVLLLPLLLALARPSLDPGRLDPVFQKDVVGEVANAGEGLATTISGARGLRLRRWCCWLLVVIPRRQQLAIRPSNLVSAHLVAIGILQQARCSEKAFHGACSLDLPVRTRLLI